MKKTLLLIDGHSQFYRAIFSPGPRLTAPKTGEPTNGTYYYTRMLLSVLRERRPQYVAVAIDGRRKDLERRRIFPAYKANRDHGQEPDLGVLVQLRRMMEITHALGLTIVQSKGWEADDVLATLTRRFKRQVDRTEIVTRDHDLHALVSERHSVNLYDPQKDLTTTYDDVVAEWGVPPKKVVEIKTLTGDSGDNVPGVGGIGPKKAKDLIHRFGTCGKARDAASLLSPAIRRVMLRADLDLSRSLVGLNSEAHLVPDVRDLESLSFAGPDFRSAHAIFTALGFRRLSDLGATS